MVKTVTPKNKQLLWSRFGCTCLFHQSKMKYFITIFYLLVVSSCSNDVRQVDVNETEMINGIVYDQSVPPYDGEPLTGILIETFENGQLKFHGNFKKGIKEGVVDFYYENGQLRKRQNHINGKITGIQEEYYPDGQLEFKGTWKDNVEHGPYWIYFYNGQLSLKGNMKEGKYEGLRETYTREGKLESKECFKNDETVDMSFCE